MSKYIVASTSEIEPGQRKIVELEGRSIGVFNLDGEYVALLNQCPHAGAELAAYGTIFGVSKAEGPDKDIDYQRGKSLRCPWHQWEFDIRTGQSWYDPKNTKVRKYEVEVVPGSPEDLMDPDGGVQKGPHVMEGYAVTVEGDMVVVDTSRRRKGTQKNNLPQAQCAVAALGPKK